MSEDRTMNMTMTKKMTVCGGLLALAALAHGCGPKALEEGGGSELLAITVSNRRPIAEVENFYKAGSYARTHDYYGYAANMLRPGMKVMFSASYGSGGGEAGQSRGVLVQGEDGGLYYKQQQNTTTQLLLPPGLSFRSSGGSSTSLWEMKSYLDLINRVAFAEASYGDEAGQGTEVYSALSAYTVDFEGGTAGSAVSYQDAMELKLEKENRGSRSNVSVYFAKGVGAVALEFRETGSVGGTFKVYIGDQGSRE
jgi:hypothetical protein